MTITMKVRWIQWYLILSIPSGGRDKRCFEIERRWKPVYSRQKWRDYCSDFLDFLVPETLWDQSFPLGSDSQNDEHQIKIILTFTVFHRWVFQTTSNPVGSQFQRESHHPILDSIMSLEWLFHGSSSYHFNTFHYGLIFHQSTKYTMKKEKE